MVVLNDMSRYHLAMLAVQRVPRLQDRAAALVAQCRRAIEEAVAYSRTHFVDPPEIREWVWID